MGWKQETGPDGLPIWRGSDGVLNVAQQEARQRGALVLPAAAMALACGVLAVGMIVAPRFYDNADALSYVAVVVVPMLGLLAVWMGKAALLGFRLRHAKRAEWLRPSWVLTASPDALAFSGSNPWRVGLRDVASVEAGRTVDHELTRDIAPLVGGRGLPLVVVIPDAEHQTFLMLSDQSRRVIYTANADREGCQTLAASIRAYIERARSSSAAPIAAPVMVAASPSGEGFDL